MSKQKVLILADWYLPGVKAGGPIRSVSGVVECLKEHLDIWLLTSDRDLNDEHAYEGIIADEWLDKDGFHICYTSPEKRKSIVRNEMQKKWSSVYLNSLFSLQFTILPLKSNNRNKLNDIVLAPRGMLGQGALEIKRTKKMLFLNVVRILRFYRNVTWIASSASEEDQIRQYFRNANVRILPNLSSILNLEFYNLPQGDKLRMVSVARVSEVKNLKFFLQVLVDFKQPYQLDIYGPMEEEGYWKQCLEIIEENQLAVSYCGEIANNQVRQTVAEYDLFVLATTGENFGHSILESLSASVPVLISNRTPWRSLESQAAGFDLPLEESKQWLHKLNQFAQQNSEDRTSFRKGAWTLANQKLDQSEIVRQYIDLLS